MILICHAIPALATLSANPWEEEIRRFEDRDQAHPPELNSVLFVGSSSIRLWPNLEQEFPNLPLLNRGFGGSQVQDLIYFYRRIITNYHPAKIVIYSGDNDLHSGLSPQQVDRKFQELEWLIHEQIDTVIYILSIKPSPARAEGVPLINHTNRLLEKSFSQNKRVQFINTFDSFLDHRGQPRGDLFQNDGLHLNKKGYQIWVDALKKYFSNSHNIARE